jgi:hypothetical protein
MQRGGCLEQIIELLFLTALFDWLQDRFGFGRGISCTGCGCGVILMILFVLLACQIIFGGALFLNFNPRGLGLLFGAW